MDNANLKREIFLKKSELRKIVWEKLDKPKTAVEISKEIGRHRSAVSRVLIDMKNAGLVKVVNPEDSSFRHYIKK